MIRSGFFSALVSATLLAGSVHAQTYTVTNNCPTAIDLFIGQNSEGSLATGASIVKTGLGPTAGFFYTTTNGGVVNGQLVAARAGFFLEPTYWYYYIVRDQNPNNFNTGISITPDKPVSDGFCTVATCNFGNCTTAYNSPPVFHSPVPPPADAPAQNPPIYQCKEPDVNFLITFCPSGTWPQAPGVEVKPNFNENKCLDVQGAVFANGTPVQVYDCNGTNAQKWVLSQGSTKVRVADTNFCLDAGSTPGNGVPMKIWQCYDNLPAQQWFYTLDYRLALEGQGQCLDLTDGDLANGNVVQTWQCSNGNNNQVWTLGV
ncbi:G-X-X-X-Q-X-W domain-containing protein [Coprinopsis cinerea okayama7|uniref:G-X-X-X-Q-X-W domain-containing protein n=1 Tax=Coprinopsis cinerea (strain Okayama-7 / 130 / ATCC MYA-4618 / FGSC 9003) TaxID=240176 RepID=A8NCX0_COPC7|nr:G-X-X-X-Q-X-W domain-containing protein [Coprinopsis cinerea okayama7\|eukprot:XP_001832648.1 G-X-X-X-Q-X-W domain-containing protein [Coprinopsis cinerea okayama7\